jgi:hypothetical protein
MKTPRILFGTNYLRCCVSDIRLWRMTVSSMENVGNTARLPVSCQIWVGAAFPVIPLRTVFLLLGLS